MSIDSKQEIQYYRHLNSLDVKNFDLGENGNNPRGDRRGSHPFFEGRLDFNGRKILFILHKDVEDEDSYIEINNLFEQLDSASELVRSSNRRSLSSDKRIESYTKAQEIYDSLGITREAWSQRDGLVSKTLYDMFRRDSKILVPGFIEETIQGFYDSKPMPNGVLMMHEDDSFRTPVKPVPRNKRDVISTQFKLSGYKGPIQFW